MNNVTLILQAVGRGERQASEELLPLVYEELRRLATARMARESAGHTLQPTALVHEAWVRLVDDGSRTWENRAHFFGAAAEAMRRILIDRARRKARLKHGGGQEQIDLEGLDAAAALPDEKILLLNEALEQLKTEDSEAAQVVMLKFFGGLTYDEMLPIFDCNERTLRRRWNYAKAWLYDYITRHH